MTITGMQPRALEQGEGRLLWHLGFLLTPKLTGQDTGGQFALVEELGGRGEAAPRHVHAREDETFLVLDGELEAWVDDQPMIAGSGGLLFLPRGREHTFRVASDTARFLLLVTPAGFERFFLDGGVEALTPTVPPPAEGPPDVAAMQAVLDGYGVTITGPPPA